MRIAAAIVTWNSMRHLQGALESLAAQTFSGLSIIVVDNASVDGPEAYVRERFPQAVFIRNVKNLGFSRGYNQAIAYARAQLVRDDEDLLVMTVSPEAIFDPEYVARVAKAMEGRPRVGSAMGKVLRAYDLRDGEFRDVAKSDVVDSAGLRIFKSRRAALRGAGGKDDGVAGREEEIFGVSSAVGMYRLRALEDVADGGQYFDEHFFSYQEDVDLAWRLRLRGWASLSVPSARAYFHRTPPSVERNSLGAALRKWRGRSPGVHRFSYRNHLLTMVKDDYFVNVCIGLPFIVWHELATAVRMLCTEPLTFFAALGDFFRLLPAALAKRGRIMRRAEASAADIRKWFA